MRRALLLFLMCLIAIFFAALVGCGNVSDQGEAPSDQSTDPGPGPSPTPEYLSGEWTLDETFEVVESREPFTCLIYEVHLSRIHSPITNFLRLDSTVTFTCVGPSVASPPTWSRLIPGETFIEGPSGNPISSKNFGGIFSRDLRRPKVGSSWPGWIEFERPASTYGTFNLYFKPNTQPTALELAAPPPPNTPTPQPTVTPSPPPTPQCAPGEPCVSFWFSTDRTTVGSPVNLSLAIVNSLYKPTMHVQLIIIIPSGWVISGIGIADACTGLYNASYEVESGENRPVSLTLAPVQVGEYDFQGSLEWFFDGPEELCSPKPCGLQVNHTVVVTE